ncbi:MAG: lamin tail domain-containing protein [Thermoplasmata archaeon]|nr:MAG: lamin tail domain-containing protein [Thermoplasmata archaeon]
MSRGRGESKCGRVFSMSICVMFVLSSLLVSIFIQIPNASAGSVSHNNGNLDINWLSDYGRILTPLIWNLPQTATDPLTGLAFIGLVVDQDNYDHTPGSEDIADCFAPPAPYMFFDDFEMIDINMVVDDGILKKSKAYFQNVGLGTGDPNDIYFEQTCWTVTNKDWAILQWKLSNLKNVPITGVHIGLELSISQVGAYFGLGGSNPDGGDDIDGFDIANGVYWAQDATGSGAGTTLGFGSAIISDPITHYYAEDYHVEFENTSDPKDPDPKYHRNFYADDTWLYERLHSSNSTAGGPGNITATIGWNGLMIPAESSRTVTIAIAVNDTFDNMLSTMEDARYYYHNIATGFLITEFSDADSTTQQIEIYNFGRPETDLSEFYFSTKSGLLTGAWNPSIIQTNEHAVFTVTGGTIGPEGDTIRLYHDLGAPPILEDEVAFGQEGVAPDPLAGESVGRRYGVEYTNEWVRSTSTGPTWGAQNDVGSVATSHQLVLNQVMFNPINPADGYLDLMYIDSSSLDISGYKIVCDDEFIVPAGTILDSNNRFYTLTQSIFPIFFANMDSSGDNIYLYDHNTNLLDMVGWNTAHTPGLSVRRIPDGKGTYQGYNDTTSEAAGWVFDYGQPPLLTPPPPTGLQARLTGSNVNVTLTWNASSDDGGGENDVAGYTVYKSSTGVNGSYEFTAWIPASGSANYNWTDVGAGDGDWNNYFYLVRANDTLNVEEQNINKVGKFVNYLIEGWNLFSKPFIQSDTSRDNVLDTLKGNYVVLQGYHAGKSRPWLHWHRDKPKKFNDEIEINHEGGYYIDMVNLDYLIVAGVVPTNTQTSLKAGWNLVGYPCLIEKTRDVALSSIAGKYNKVEYYDTSLDKEVRLEPDELMQTGLGYWIHATEDCVLIL